MAATDIVELNTYLAQHGFSTEFDQEEMCAAAPGSWQRAEQCVRLERTVSAAALGRAAVGAGRASTPGLVRRPRSCSSPHRALPKVPGMEVAPTPGTQALLSPLRDVVALSPRRASKPLLPPLLPPSTAGGSEARKADSPAARTPKPLTAPRRDEGQVDGALASPENEYVEEGRSAASVPTPRRRRATWAAAGSAALELERRPAQGCYRGASFLQETLDALAPQGGKPTPCDDSLEEESFKSGASRPSSPSSRWYALFARDRPVELAPAPSSSLPGSGAPVTPDVAQKALNEYIEEGPPAASAPTPRRRRATWAAAGSAALELERRSEAARVRHADHKAWITEASVVLSPPGPRPSLFDVYSTFSERHGMMMQSIARAHELPPDAGEAPGA